MWEFLKQLFGIKTKDSAEDPMKKFLIVGLGNIGPEYEFTRHNIGFDILDHYVDTSETNFEIAKLGSVAKHRLKGRQLIFLKPSTYMNLSGKAVKFWMQKEKIPQENLLIITDDLNLPFGTLRLKTKGSDGGHNGLKDIQNQLGTTKYNRLRFGISDEFQKGRQVDYVLSKWEDEEKEKLPERFEVVKDLINSFVLAGVTETMNNFNGK